jgi:hypothetical protein
VYECKDDICRNYCRNGGGMKDNCRGGEFKDDILDRL